MNETHDETSTTGRKGSAEVPGSELGWRSFHMGQSITGPLRNWRKADWKRATKYITRNDGSRYSADELKDVFLKELALGHEVVPIGQCDNWDWKKGCGGHPAQNSD